MQTIQLKRIRPELLSKLINTISPKERFNEALERKANQLSRYAPKEIASLLLDMVNDIENPNTELDFISQGNKLGEFVEVLGKAIFDGNIFYLLDVLFYIFGEDDNANNELAQFKNKLRHSKNAKWLFYHLLTMLKLAYGFSCNCDEERWKNALRYIAQEFKPLLESYASAFDPSCNDADWTKLEDNNKVLNSFLEPKLKYSLGALTFKDVQFMAMPPRLLHYAMLLFHNQFRFFNAPNLSAEDQEYLYDVFLPNMQAAWYQALLSHGDPNTLKNIMFPFLFPQEQDCPQHIQCRPLYVYFSEGDDNDNALNNYIIRDLPTGTKIKTVKLDFNSNQPTINEANFDPGQHPKQLTLLSSPPSNTSVLLEIPPKNNSTTSKCQLFDFNDVHQTFIPRTHTFACCQDDNENIDEGFLEELMGLLNQPNTGDFFATFYPFLDNVLDEHGTEQVKALPIFNPKNKPKFPYAMFVYALPRLLNTAAYQHIDISTLNIADTDSAYAYSDIEHIPLNQLPAELLTEFFPDIETS